MIQKKLDFSSGEVHVLNQGSSVVYTHLTVRKRANINEIIQPQASGVKVSVEWQSLDGKPIKVDKLKQGTEFRAVITVNELTGTTTSESTALVLTAPSGWEIWNDRLFGGTEGGIDYRDIRDNDVRWYFTLRSGSTRQFKIRLQASYEGAFHLPEIVCEDMYNAPYKSNTGSGSVCVSQ